MSETAYEVGVVMGTTVIGGVAAAWYRLGLVVPEGVGDEMAAGTVTLGGAHALALDLPAEVGRELVEAANVAFGGGVAVASGLTAGFIVLFATYAYRGLRQI